MLGGLRGEDSIAELCRREGIVQNLYCRCRGLLRGGRRAGTAIPVDPPVPAGIRSEHSVGIRDDTPWVDRSTPAASSRCAAAKLYLTWFLAKEQQSRVGSFSSRIDVPPPEGFQPLSSYKIANNYREFMTNDKLVAELRKRFEGYTGPPVNRGGVR